MSEPKQKLTDIHPLSSTTTLIEICLTTKDEKLEEKKIGVGTGFFYTANSGEPYIITNRHNVAKKDAFIYPEHLWIEIKTHDVKELNEKGHPTCYERRAKLALYNLSSEANWFEHPIYREQVDVAAIPINTILGRLEKNELIAAINQYACFEEMYFDVGSEVFVIGYPLGLTAGKFPIWKRGSIASDVEVDLEGVPKMYVDTASRKGMSGAPVVVLRRGENLPKPQGAIFTSPIDEASRLVGVYSGRYGVELDVNGQERYDNFIQAQMGLVWKKKVIDEIIEGKLKGPSIEKQSEKIPNQRQPNLIRGLRWILKNRFT